jgi:hypothetical protein
MARAFYYASWPRTNEISRRAVGPITKRQLTLCRITQDGDDEGYLHLDQLPTPLQAGLIRLALRIRKRRTLSPIRCGQKSANRPSHRCPLHSRVLPAPSLSW